MKDFPRENYNILLWKTRIGGLNREGYLTERKIRGICGWTTITKVPLKNHVQSFLKHIHILKEPKWNH